MHWKDTASMENGGGGPQRQPQPEAGITMAHTPTQQEVIILDVKGMKAVE